MAIATLPLRAIGLGLVLVLLGCPVVLQAMAQSPPQTATPDDEASARARQIDELFARLKTAKLEQDGDEIVSQIWKLWLQSGDPGVDAKMQHVVLVMGQVPALALPILDDIVRQKPSWAEAWNKRATVLYLIGEYDRSLADIDRVLALEPRHFGALAGIGLIRIEKGETREALAAFRRALAVNPFLKERFGIVPALEKELGEKPI